MARARAERRGDPHQLGWSTGAEDIERFIAAWRGVYGKFAERRRAA
ncbi:MAG: hypothetical protein HC850_09045 [Rhodomicrobium sp.]|nr:hypothetical protein [Rhodomicrobium sp.]